MSKDQRYVLPWKLKEDDGDVGKNGIEEQIESMKLEMFHMRDNITSKLSIISQVLGVKNY